MSFHVVTGFAADGRSTVISREPKANFAASGFAEITDDSSIRKGNDQAVPTIAKLYESDSPAKIKRSARGELLPIPTPPGGALWLEMKFDGAYETEFHRTDSIDLHYIVAGEVELILEDGSVTLRAGDTAMLPGVVHRWRTSTAWHSSLLVLGIIPT